MQQYDRLKNYSVNSVLTLFIVIAASRPLNKNVSTCAFIRAKQSTEPGIHKLLANYQTGGYKIRPIIGWNGRIRSRRQNSFSFMKFMNTLTKSTQA